MITTVNKSPDIQLTIEMQSTYLDFHPKHRRSQSCVVQEESDAVVIYSLEFDGSPQPRDCFLSHFELIRHIMTVS